MTIQSPKYISLTTHSDDDINKIINLDVTTLESKSSKYTFRDISKRVIKIKLKTFDRFCTLDFPAAVLSFVNHPYYNKDQYIIIVRSKDKVRTNECYFVNSDDISASWETFSSELHVFTNKHITNKELGRVENIFLVSHAKHHDYFNSEYLSEVEKKN